MGLKLRKMHPPQPSPKAGSARTNVAHGIERDLQPSTRIKYGAGLAQVTVCASIKQDAKYLCKSNSYARLTISIALYTSHEKTRSLCAAACDRRLIQIFARRGHISTQTRSCPDAY